MSKGVAFALGAGILWGLVFVTPLWLEGYPSLLLAAGRYLAFGLVVLPLAWIGRHQLAQLTRADWLEAGKLSLVGNLMYYTALALGVQLSSAPIVSVVIGTLPIWIALVSNWTERTVSWRAIGLPLILTAIGVLLVNQEEMEIAFKGLGQSTSAYGFGVLSALIALVCWTWYPIRNGRWLQSNPQHSSSTWATAQGLTTLPLALIGYALCGALLAIQAPGFAQPNFEFPLGPQPLRFVGLMLILGIFASWLGTAFWNRASQLLPAGLLGQMIVFETVFALLYAFIWRATQTSAPTALGALTIVGILLQLAGVIGAVRVFQSAQVAAAARATPRKSTKTPR
jgi:drug/metabolite transporter (DMT)-like permease